jgi:hypothetical protein
MKAVALQSSDSVAARKSPQAVAPRPFFLKPFFYQAGPSDETLIQRKANCACGGGCQRCSEDSEHPRIQTKLAISSPADPYEQEADRVAEQVLAEPERSSANSGPPPIQRYTGEAGVEATRASANVAQVLAGSGRPLEGQLRQDMEWRFGHDFSQVRVHTSASAAESARAVNALAYTQGSNIAFAEGHYDPARSDGRRLLAHELTHVIQQSGSPKSPNIHGKGLMDARSPANTVFRDVRIGMPPRASSDPIHDPLIKEYRRQHGLPPGGKDEFGNPVGPSDGEIKYLLLPLPKPPCHEVGAPSTLEGRRRALCISDDMKKEPPDCEFTSTQEKFVAAAKREAAARVLRALERVQSGKDGERFAGELAGRLFNFDPPPILEIKEVLRRVSDFLSGSGVRVAAKGCGEPECHRGATVAYVTAAGTMPIYLCPLAFADPGTLHKTIIHEALHWSGLDADPATPEGYCEKYDCITACLTKSDADAWAHYVDCLGQPLETRRSFKDKIGEEIP